jgi:hypothetical protein
MLTSSNCRKTLVVTLLVMLLMTVVFGAGPSNGILRGRLVDSVEHTRINRAFILVHRHGTESDGEKLPVDNNGSFSAELSPGFYDVFVSSRGFSPACGQVEVEAGKTVVWNSELKMSELLNTPD